MPEHSLVSGECCIFVSVLSSLTPQPPKSQAGWQIVYCPMLHADRACAGSYFVLSMLDRLWHQDLTQDEAVELMEKGIEEVG